MIYGLWFKTDSCQGVANKHAIINADIRENKNITYSDTQLCSEDVTSCVLEVVGSSSVSLVDQNLRRKFVFLMFTRSWILDYFFRRLYDWDKHLWTICTKLQKDGGGLGELHKNGHLLAHTTFIVSDFLVAQTWDQPADTLVKCYLFKNI